MSQIPRSFNVFTPYSWNGLPSFFPNKDITIYIQNQPLQGPSHCMLLNFIFFFLKKMYLLSPNRYNLFFQLYNIYTDCLLAVYITDLKCWITWLLQLHCHLNDFSLFTEPLLLSSCQTGRHSPQGMASGHVVSQYSSSSKKVLLKNGSSFKIRHKSHVIDGPLSVPAEHFALALCAILRTQTKNSVGSQAWVLSSC